VSVGHNSEPCKTDEPIEVPSGTWTRVGPRNHVLDGDPDTPDKGAVIYLWIYISWPIIKYIDYPGAVEFGRWQQRCGLFDVTVL